MRGILAELDATSRAIAAADAMQVHVLANAAEVGIRLATELRATSWREAEEPMRAVAEQLGAAANMDARTVRRLMNEALLARREAQRHRAPSFFRTPRPGQ